jgi:REP-associated tyrosine transposase
MLRGMPRAPRDVAPGIFHVYTHCVWAVPALFRDDIDRMTFVRRLAHVTAQHAWRCLGFCLMTSHYHMLVEVGDGVLPRAMHGLNLPYARAFNDRFDLKGHVQFDRYGSRRIEDDDDLLDTYAYVANNPVKAGMCATPEEWIWSSYAGTIGVAEPHSFVDPVPLLRCVRGAGVDKRVALRRHVEKWWHARASTWYRDVARGDARAG